MLRVSEVTSSKVLIKKPAKNQLRILQAYQKRL